MMCPLHVFLNLGYRDIKIQSKRQYHTSNQHDKHGKRSIFKIRDLDFHGPEFDSPANIRARGRGFESHVLPIRRLQVFKVIIVYFVILIYRFVEYDEGVPNE